MATVRLLQPKRIIFGPGCAAQCAEDILALGLRRVFVVTSPPTARLVEPIAAALEAGGARVTVYTDIAGEPTVSMFARTLAAARAAGPDAVVGLGGGSPMDVAKLVAALCEGTQTVQEVFGIEKLASRSLYLACLPTTAGTGSEVSPNSILLDEAEKLKKGVVSPHLVPDAAYVDPVLTVSMPPPVTAATGLDALIHCIETYANKFAHPIVDMYSLQGIRAIGANLLQAVRHGDDLEARTNMAMGSLLGGLCLAPVNTAAAHALAYPLAGEFHVSHGISTAVLLPAVMRFNLPAAPERYAQIALALGVQPGASAVETAQRGIDRIVEMCRACDMPLHLADLGIPREAIPGMAQAAMKVTRLLRNNLREVTVADAEAIYREAY